jgi:deoxyribose-phosphate aldolase
MGDAVGGRLGVKASGGIRTTTDAAAMIRGGPLSGNRMVLDGLG